MQDLPTVLRAADLRGLAQAAMPLLPQGAGLGDIEKMLAFVERAVPLFEKFSQSMMAMRQFEGGGSGAAPGENPEIWEGGPPDMRAAPPPRQTVQPVHPTTAATPIAATPPDIDAHKVYAALLGAMAQAPPDMLVSDALILARDHKALIIPQIEAELKNL
jgi:hypothetical protein